MRSLLHIRRRQDLRLVLLVISSLALIGFHLEQTGRGTGKAGAVWRNLDLDALQRRIETGDLSDHEADWYQPAQNNRIERNTKHGQL